MKTNNKYTTEVTDEEIANGIKDEYGCTYSPDGKRLLKGNEDIKVGYKNSLSNKIENLPLLFC